MKCRSRSLAFYNNEFILGYTCCLRKSLWDRKSLKICYLLNISQKKVYRIKISEVNELKRLINSKWAAPSHTVIECAVVELHQGLRACVRTGGGHFEWFFLTTCCNKDDVMWHVWFFERQLTIADSHVFRYSVNQSNVHLLILCRRLNLPDTSNFPR